MKTPPLLLMAALLFWGWQSGLPLVGAIMGVILESAWFIKVRWDFSDADFRRILTFCTLFAFAATLYFFAAAQEAGGGFHGSPAAVGHAMQISSLKSSTTFFQWLPIFLFLFVAAQTFGAREKIPLTAISIISRWRAQQDQKRGNAPAGRSVNVSYPYFIVCLFSAGIHTNEGGGAFFLGQCYLIFWALWPFRPRRFGIPVWALALAAALAFSYFGQRGISELQQYNGGYIARLLAQFMRQWADPMQSTTAIGQIGKLKLSGQIVIRLRTKTGEPPPVYLREASYRTYHSQKQDWNAGSPRSEFDNNSVTPEHDQTTWILLPEKTNTASVNIACHIYGGKSLLPLPTGSGRLENLNAYLLHKNSEGAVLADGPGLVIFEARYGPGATIDSPPDASTNRLDLKVETNEIAALDSVISEMKISGTNEEQKLLAVQNFFAGKFTYSLWQGPDKLATTNETSLTRFLLHSRSGHCEYFATATVLLLRELGIPARYAVGYAVHETSRHGYVVRERDAHAWCLVWNERIKNWEDFDTTPASWIGIEGKRASFMQWFSDSWSWVGFQISKFRWGQSNLREYILWALVPLLALLLYQIIFRRGRRRRLQPKAGKSAAEIFWPGLDSEFYLLERKLAARGVARQPSEPLSDWLTRALAAPALADLRTPLQELLRLHYAYRFDPRGLSGREREALTREAKICLDTLSRLERPKI
ncbi:MAG: transglutaminase domain-containing protein [Verrucomicrobiota bacterium]